MAKFFVILMFCSILAVAIPEAYSLALPTLKKTNLHCFVHDKVTGANQSGYTIATSDITATSPTAFGLTAVFDVLVTLEPEYESDLLGHAQGMATYADFNTPAMHVSITLVFTNAEYNGSTINIIGRNPVNLPMRQFSIVGGTGAFEMAQGIINSTKYSSFTDETTNYVVWEYQGVIYQYLVNENALVI